MRIECPDCKLSGNIDDSTVPATGLAMVCPRCKKSFTVERQVMAAGSASAMLDSCPKCQYATFSDEKFAICPRCGLVVADYHKEQLAARQQKSRPVPPQAVQRQQSVQQEPSIPRMTPEQQLKDEEARRKYGIDTPPGAVDMEEEPAAAAPSGEAPLPVLIAGWGVIVVSILLFGFGISGVMEYLAKVKAARAAIAAFEEAQSESALFFQFLLFPVLSVIFSAVMLFFGSRFLAMRKWSIAALHNGAWTGVVLLALMKVSDMVFWFKRASATAPFGYYAMGVFSDALLMLLFIAPFFVLTEFLKSSLFEKSEELFY